MRNKFLIIILLFGILSYGEAVDLIRIFNYELNNHYSTVMTGMTPVLFINDFNTAIMKLSENTLLRIPDKREVNLQTREIGVDYKDKRNSIISKFLNIK